MQVKEYDYIKGSTAVNPSRKSTIRRPKKSKQNLRKVKKNKSIKIKNEKVEARKSTLIISILIVSLGLMTIAGDTKVYSMQKNLGKINGKINNAQETNEALKVKLLKFGSLQNIQETSEKQLSMSMPTKDDIVKVDFSENYFANIEKNTATEINKKQGFLSKILDKFR
ncbi:cell division protein FtsL [Clostridium taeniosporum]|uniref:Cell division protein FtsL n=1 Tax=Clostridium taeniosporum TaxID=394958 RepID=A0A1D7XKY0_9CLOT|nr:cell division protein FtsL [Clostridium taeniosporum]